jgi:hypothetical protein
MKMDSENISAHMPQDREMPEYCRVKNFETCLQKLHPQCNRLWQFPKDSFNILMKHVDILQLTRQICVR